MKASVQRRSQAAFEDALALHKAGRLDEAARAYDALLRRDSAFSSAHMMKGVLALQRGQASAALESLDRARRLDDRHPGIHLNRGNALRALQRLDDAAAAYRSALALDPSMLFAHNNLGNVLRDQGRLEDALACYERALALDAGFFPACANRAQTLTAAKRDRAALVEAYERALGLAQAQSLTGATVADCHNALGNLHAAEQSLEAALTHYDQAVAQDPGFAEAHVNRASTLARATRLEEAADAFRTALALQPANKHAYKRLGLTLRRLGREAEAADVYRTWARLDPDDPIPAHMALSLTDGAPPERATEEYVRREFDDFAEAFDRVLTQLGYQAPRLVGEAVGRHRDAARPAVVLDAGCGTGLCGSYVRPFASSLVGVDLSKAMLAQASQRGLYDELVESEIGQYATGQSRRFDVIVAADVLIYIGKLEPVVAAFGEALADGGLLVVTVEAALAEHGATGGYALHAGGRYSHERTYVEKTLADQSLRVRETTQVSLRRERDTEVMGWLVVAEREPRTG